MRGQSGGARQILAAGSSPASARAAPGRRHPGGDGREVGQHAGAVGRPHSSPRRGDASRPPALGWAKSAIDSVGDALRAASVCPVSRHTGIGSDGRLPARKRFQTGAGSFDPSCRPRRKLSQAHPHRKLPNDPQRAERADHRHMSSTSRHRCQPPSAALARPSVLGSRLCCPSSRAVVAPEHPRVVVLGKPGGTAPGAGSGSVDASSGRSRRRGFVPSAVAGA